MSLPLRHLVVPLFLVACLLLGGSPQGIWRNLLLQLMGLGLIGWALLARQRSHPTSAGRLLLWLAMWWFALVLAQLVPLPPSLWTSLPRRSAVAESFVLRGEALPWLPWSMTPATTAAVLPVMAVPLGMAAAILILGAYRSRWCIAALGLGTSLSVLLGAVQVSSGGPYFYPRHNAGEAAGLFANSNHQATLLLATIPFLAAVISEGPRRSARNASAHVGRIMIALVALAVIMIGVALNGSLAGLGLLLPVGLGSLALALSSSQRAPRLLAFLALLLVLLAAVGVGLFSDVGGNDSSIAERRDIYRITLAAIGDTFPVGIGLGAFQPFYRLYEDPALVTNFFINHAHSDPLEWVLETGLPGVLLLAALLFWWAVRAMKLWRADRPDPIALAATVASGAILAHSVVDYPLRDAAIQAVFAMSLAFMAEPRSHSARRSASPVTQAAPRHLTIDDDVSVSG